MPEVIQSPDDRAKNPVHDEKTRALLKANGFDLARYFNWWDDPDTNCRHFTQ